VTSTGNLWRWAALLALSAALAFIFERAAFPAALLLGPMLSAIVFGVAGNKMSIPRAAFFGAQAIVGCLVARAINAPIVMQIAQDWVVMLAVVASTIVAAGFVGWLLAKSHTLPGSTAAWGSSPGAAAAMVSLAEDFGADARLVAFMQYLRIIIVVLTASFVSKLLLGAGFVPAAHAAIATPPLFAAPLVPLLETLAIAGLGAYLGRRFNLPAGPLMLPMIGGAILHATGVVSITLPFWLLALAYTAVGWYVGLQFTRETLLYALRSLPQILIATVALIGLCGISAWVLTRFAHTDALTAYLATSPGGLDSVAIIALGSGANIPFVLAIQTLRVFVVIVTGPPVAKFIARVA
jgi:membrane AbrB-like protein